MFIFNLFPLNFVLQSDTESWHSVTAESECLHFFNVTLTFSSVRLSPPRSTWSDSFFFPHVSVILLVHVDGTSVKNPDNEEQCVCVCVCG